MTHFTVTKPIIMGALMGLMMLWMMHGALTGQSDLGLGALVVFVVAHVAIVLVLIGLAMFGARLSPKLRAWTGRLHRPSYAHLIVMLAGAVVAVGAAHLLLHGGL